MTDSMAIGFSGVIANRRSVMSQGARHNTRGGALTTETPSGKRLSKHWAFVESQRDGSRPRTAVRHAETALSGFGVWMMQLPVVGPLIRRMAS